VTTLAPPNATLLTDLSPYVYGSTRLGDESLPISRRVSLARAAMDAGVWFHASDQYGSALDVLRAAFDEDRARVPKLIFKIGGGDARELSVSIERQLAALGIDRMDIGQLCIGGDLAEQLGSGGACYDEFRRIRARGLVERFVLEVFPWTSRAPLAAVEGSYVDGIVDGCIFYLNPLQRFASNTLWDRIQERNLPIIAMRTVSGGPVHRLRDVPGAAWKPYLQERAAEVAPIFERSGVSSWTEFCVRFAHSFAQTRATVGATGDVEHLRAFLDAAGISKGRAAIEPLAADLVSDIVRLQYRWSDELDVVAEPWSM
jgi:hypothetical protein